MGGRYEPKPRRPLLGADLRIGALLTLALALKFAPPMLSAKLDKTPLAPVLMATGDRSRPPTDALTNTLPTSVRQVSTTADDPPVLTAPVFAFEEKKSSIANADPILPESPHLDSLEPPKPATKPNLALQKADNPPSPKAVKLRPPESQRSEPPIVLADAQKKSSESTNAAATKTALREADVKAPEKKGPIHPYFQRYLDQKEYYVRPGDTLELIAHRLYQDNSRAAALLAANKDVLSAPDSLKAGMTLKLP